jgi:hypothetical protein
MELNKKQKARVLEKFIRELEYPLGVVIVRTCEFYIDISRQLTALVQSVMTLMK